MEATAVEESRVTARKDNDLTPIPLMELVTGFWGFKTLTAAIGLELFTHFSRRGPATCEAVCTVLRLERRPTDALLAACASLGLLEKSGDRYRNTALAEKFLVIGRPFYFGSFVRFSDQREYPAWHHIVDALRKNQPTAWDPEAQESPFIPQDPVMRDLFLEAMHSLSTFTAKVLGDTCDFTGYSRVLDVGGGSGAFLTELCRRHPHLSGTVFDLPHVCDIAQQKIAAAGMDHAVTTFTGDFHSDEPLPTGYDLILLSMILHNWDETTNRRILAKCHTALRPGGTVMVCELVLNPERTGPRSAALMGMNMLVLTDGGQNYSQTDYETWLTEAGFEEPSLIPLDAAGANAALVAVRS
ncbi:methyltransferase domain-containing protein [Streptomyces sp. PTM05]|uniref:Methyltransferase domain-containing protein n=1 Tax=Streptantibioticus parmotrematis TaxID=2873249 RepID=A0ABS7QUW1_9ACTN|nr:methyltransferase domain-containing protein [Streptantibioticus parmotrematis]